MNIRSFCISGVAALLSVATFATATAQSAKTFPSEAGATAPAAASPLPPQESNTYIIGPGDSIQVFVWRNPELSASIPVRPDGKISTPLVEDMIAVGKTPSQLARDIEKQLAEYIRSPQVNIIVNKPASTFSQVRIIGKVGAPQSIPYREGLTLLDVLLAVGGLSEFAAGNRAKLVRTDANGKQTEIKLRLNDLVNKGDMSRNVDMKPGDVIVVPQARF
jgi:polysaccharide biosynthesis/export protein